MKVVTTAKVKLADFSQVLDETMSVYAQAVQFCVDTAWEHKIAHKTPLHAHCYYELRERFHDFAYDEGETLPLEGIGLIPSAAKSSPL